MKHKKQSGMVMFMQKLITNVKIFCNGKQVSEKQFRFLAMLNMTIRNSCAFGSAYMDDLIYKYADVDLHGHGQSAYVFFCQSGMEQFIADSQNYLKLLGDRIG